MIDPTHKQATGGKRNHDRDDDRRLPDGSRWVDAEALHHIILYVAGMPA